ncbi:MAG: hypothetical protein PHE27_02785 [Alphaproteobacteria bacterium]|nr:hypothetical protein [Alphaproteobacteria bacterium]
MKKAIKKLLLNTVALDQDNKRIVRSELSRGASLETVLIKLPVEARIGLLDHLSATGNPNIEAMPARAYDDLIDALGKTINILVPETMEAMVSASIGHASVRLESGSDNPAGDGVLSLADNNGQRYLASTLTQYLPYALDVSPENLISSRIGETELGVSMAILFVPRKDKSAIVANAQNLIGRMVRLTPACWKGFKKTCEAMDNKQTPMGACACALVDTLVSRQIFALSPGDIAALSDRQARYYITAMNWTGDPKSPVFIETQRYFYANLNPLKALTRHREAQIDKAVLHFQNMPDDTFQDVLNIKNGWRSFSNEEKKLTLENYVLRLARFLETPKPPNISILKQKNLPDVSNYYSNGYYNAFGQNPNNSVYWKNDIVLVDGNDRMGLPLAINKSFRSALSTTAHEMLHSDDGQIFLRHPLTSTPHQVAYALAFSPLAPPASFTDKDPLAVFAAAFSFIRFGRAPTVRASQDFEIYRAQPNEKTAWGFQNQFAAALNGMIVFRQTEAGTRDLCKELRSAFSDIAQVLADRKSLTGADYDLTKMNAGNGSSGLFGAMALMDDEASRQEQSGAAVRLDYSAADGRSEIAGRLQAALETLASETNASHEDYALLFRQSADFLVQMPDELWAIKHLMGKDGLRCSTLDALAAQLYELGEDCNDYCFFAERSRQAAERAHDRNRALARYTPDA